MPLRDDLGPEVKVDSFTLLSEEREKQVKNRFAGTRTLIIRLL